MKRRPWSELADAAGWFLLTGCALVVLYALAGLLRKGG